MQACVDDAGSCRLMYIGVPAWYPSFQNSCLISHSPHHSHGRHTYVLSWSWLWQSSPVSIGFCFLKSIIIVCAWCTWEDIQMPHHVCEDQRTTLKSQFSPSTSMWVPGIRIQSSPLCGMHFTSWTIYPRVTFWNYELELGYSSVVQCLPSMHEALGSISSTTTNKKNNDLAHITSCSKPSNYFPSYLKEEATCVMIQRTFVTFLVTQNPNSTSISSKLPLEFWWVVDCFSL